MQVSKNMEFTAAWSAGGSPVTKARAARAAPVRYGHVLKARPHVAFGTAIWTTLRFALALVPWSALVWMFTY